MEPMTFITQKLDARGLYGPLPILRAEKTINDLDCGDVLMVNATDPKSLEKVDLFCQETGNELLEHLEWDGEFTFLIRKFCSESDIGH